MSGSVHVRVVMDATRVRVCLKSDRTMTETKSTELIFSQAVVSLQ